MSLSNDRVRSERACVECSLSRFESNFFSLDRAKESDIIFNNWSEMALEIVFKLVYYVSHVIKGLVEIAIGKDESIYDDQGNILSKLPSKRKQVLVFAKNFFKEPVSVVIMSDYSAN